MSRASHGSDSVDAVLKNIKENVESDIVQIFPRLISKTTWSEQKTFGIRNIHIISGNWYESEIPPKQSGTFWIPAPRPRGTGKVCILSAERPVLQRCACYPSPECAQGIEPIRIGPLKAIQAA